MVHASGLGNRAAHTEWMENLLLDERGERLVGSGLEGVRNVVEG